MLRTPCTQCGTTAELSDEGLCVLCWDAKVDAAHREEQRAYDAARREEKRAYDAARYAAHKNGARNES